MKRAIILTVFLLGLCCMLLLLGKPSLVVGRDAIGVKVTKVSDDYPTVQILDEVRGVVCYTYSTPAGTSISCVKY